MNVFIFLMPRRKLHNSKMRTSSIRKSHHEALSIYPNIVKNNLNYEFQQKNLPKKTDNCGTLTKILLITSFVCTW